MLVIIGKPGLQIEGRGEEDATKKFDIRDYDEIQFALVC